MVAVRPGQAPPETKPRFAYADNLKVVLVVLPGVSRVV